MFADSLRNTITSGVTEVIPGVLSANKNFSYAQIAKQVQFWIFVFIGLIAVAYIIYIGAKLLWAPGSMEEMTKSLVSLAYVVVGLALIDRQRRIELCKIAIGRIQRANVEIGKCAG